MQPHLMASSLPPAGTSLARRCSWAGPLPAWPCWGAPSSAVHAQSPRESTAAHSPTGRAPPLPPESTSEPTSPSQQSPTQHSTAPAALWAGPVGHGCPLSSVRTLSSLFPIQAPTFRPETQTQTLRGRPEAGPSPQVHAHVQVQAWAPSLSLMLSACPPPSSCRLFHRQLLYSLKGYKSVCTVLNLGTWQ